MGESDIDDGIGFDVEQEWKHIDKLLAQKSASAWGMGLLEAHKTFREALAEVSYGATVADQIHNAAELFADINKLMQAHELYLMTINQTGFMPDQKDAQKACDILLRSILDMTGRDFVRFGAWHRLNNSLNFFWGNHPKFLVYVLSGLLLFVGAVWALNHTPVGKWLVNLLVGFADFMVGNEPLLIGLAGAWAIAVVLSLFFYRRR